jgi:hypothetical protein
LAYIKRLFASLGHGLLWLAVTYVIWGLVVRNRYIDAWNAAAVGDTVPIVINSFGSPDYVESPLAFSQPDFCARPQEKCRDDLRSDSGINFRSLSSLVGTCWSLISMIANTSCAALRFKPLFIESALPIGGI